MKRTNRMRLNLKTLRKMSSKLRTLFKDMIQMMKAKGWLVNGRIATTTQTKKWRSTRQLAKLK